MPPRRNAAIKPTTTTATITTRATARNRSNNTTTSNASTAARPMIGRDDDDNGNEYVDDEEHENGDEDEEDDPNVELALLFEKLHKAVCISLHTMILYLHVIEYSKTRAQIHGWVANIFSTQTHQRRRKKRRDLKAGYTVALDKSMTDAMVRMKAREDKMYPTHLHHLDSSFFPHTTFLTTSLPVGKIAPQYAIRFSSSSWKLYSSGERWSGRLQNCCKKLMRT